MKYRISIEVEEEGNEKSYWQGKEVYAQIVDNIDVKKVIEAVNSEDN